MLNMKKNIEVGQKFGRLEISSEAERSKDKVQQWNCFCECGSKVVVKKYCLLSGGTKSCGCLKRETTSKNKLKNVVGQRFGRLLVLRRSDDPKWNRVFWICKCDCGKEVEVGSENLLSGNTKSCGCYSLEIKKARATLLTTDACVFDRFKDYRKEAENRKLSFNISLEEFKSFTSENCHYCGKLPSQVIPQSRSKIPYFYSGIDRKDNSIGYEFENCLPCCKQCNFAKSGRSYDEFQSWIKRLVEFNERT